MRKFDLSLRSSRSSYFATFRHQLTILSKTDALDEEKWLNMLGTFVKDWFRYESRSEERFSRNAETDLVCRLLLEKKNRDGRPRSLARGGAARERARRRPAPHRRRLRQAARRGAPLPDDRPRVRGVRSARPGQLRLHRDALARRPEPDDDRRAPGGRGAGHREVRQRRAPAAV